MTPSSRLLTGLVLTGIAGFVDTVAFMELGGYFASFMSGNTTQLALGISDPTGGAVGLLRDYPILMPVVLLSLFFAGAFFAALLAEGSRHWRERRVLALIIVIITIAFVLDRSDVSSFPPMVLLAAAMGAQNATLQPVGAARLGATFVTGTLFNTASDLAKAILGEAPRWRWLQHAMVWGALITGAALGAISHRIIGVYTLLLPIVGLFLLIVYLTFRPHKADHLTR